MKKYKCIIWDWNGTLLDDSDICINVMNKVLSKRNLPILTSERYRQVFGFPVRDYYDQLGFDYSQEPFETVSMEFISEYQKLSLAGKLRTDCVDTLKYCKQEGLTQVVLSASQIDNLTAQVKHFGIMDYFHTLLGLEHCHATSKVEVGRQWLDVSGFAKEDVILIGDTIHDYETTRKLRCDCVLLSSGHQSRERLAQLGTPIIEDLKDLRLWL